jgi:hypothetical protein
LFLGEILSGLQTTLQKIKAPNLEEFEKEHKESLVFLLEKYKAWKELKEKEKRKGVVVEV